VIWLTLALAVISWLGILVLQSVLMSIAIFFEKNSGKKTWYRGYLVPMLLSTFGAGRYIWHLSSHTFSLNFVGDPPANLALFCAGLTLIILSAHLYEEMMEDHQAL
jgi:hypothetical protein